MNTDIKKLQVLNDLISQTLDAINQRSVSYFGGLSHSPYLSDIRIDPRLDPRQQFQMFGPSVGINPQLNVPNFPVMGVQSGLTHSPFVSDPRFDPRIDPRIDPRLQFGQTVQQNYPVMGLSSGLSHTPFTQTYSVIDPRFIQGLDYRSNIPQQLPQNLTMGLSHTPYIPQNPFIVPNIPTHIAGQINTPWGW